MKTINALNVDNDDSELVISSPDMLSIFCVINFYNDYIASLYHL